jgi:hypothetical protein
MRWLSSLAIGAGAVLATSGCSSSGNAAAGFAAGEPAPNGPANASAGGSVSGSSQGASSSSAAALPAETKIESAFQSPVATGQVVWTANPTSGRVAYIDATTFDVATVLAGDGPTYLAAVADPVDDVAIVLNVLSQNATLLRDHEGVLTTTTYPASPNANAWAVSASGRWAIAWTNTSILTDAGATQGFQDVEVIDLLAPSADGGAAPQPPTDLIVGFRPVQVVYAEPPADAGALTETRAYAVTEDGISVIDLVDGPAPKVIANYPLSAPASALAPPEASTPSDDGGDDASASSDAASGDDAAASLSSPSAPAAGTAPDVSITPDGSYALVRQDGVPSITVVSLLDGTTTAVALPALPTDLTLSPDGTFAIAVLRDISTVVTLPIPGIAADPTAFTSTTIAGQTIGRALVTPDAKSAILFTTAAPVSSLTILSLGATPTANTIALHAPVLAVFPTSDSANAIVLHNITPSDGVEGAFSIVPIASSLPANLVSLPAPPTAVALAPSGDRALVTMSDPASATFGAYLAKMPSLQAIPYPLASAPLAAGIVAGASAAYVTENYAEGRITFIDLQADGGAGGARTITGFELGARIVEGSTP